MGVRIARNLRGAMAALLVLFAVTACGFAVAQTSQASQQAVQPLQITTTRLPDGFVGDGYEAKFEAQQGLPPYTWMLGPQSTLPPGLTLGKNGALAGTPTKPGEYTFTIELRDEGPPSGWVQREFKISIKAAFAVVWQRGPAVVGNQIVGQVVVYNNVADPVDLTVIVVAVNEIGKAFALGYERLELGAKTQSGAIRFGGNMNLPTGKYVVHVDAIGEVPSKNTIRRARQQTPTALTVVSR